jgi:DNA-binding ferritin-like protein
MNAADVVTWALGLLSQIKLLHWATSSYAVHKALDGLHDALAAQTDRFVEVYMGRHGVRGAALKNVVVTSRAHGDAGKWEEVLEGMRAQMVAMHKQLSAGKAPASELANILDEMTAAVGQALYLGRLG